MTVEHEVKLGRTEMSMIKWICLFTLKERNCRAGRIVGIRTSQLDD